MRRTDTAFGHPVRASVNVEIQDPGENLIRCTPRTTYYAPRTAHALIRIVSPSSYEPNERDKRNEPPNIVLVEAGSERSYMIRRDHIS